MKIFLDPHQPTFSLTYLVNLFPSPIRFFQVSTRCGDLAYIEYRLDHYCCLETPWIKLGTHYGHPFFANENSIFDQSKARVII